MVNYTMHLSPDDLSAIKAALSFHRRGISRVLLANQKLKEYERLQLEDRKRAIRLLEERITHLSA